MRAKCPVCGDAVLRKGGYLVTGEALAAADDELHDVALERDPALVPYDRAVHAERLVKRAVRRPEREWLLCTACGMGVLPDPAARQAAAQAALAWWAGCELPPAPLAAGSGQQRRGVFPDGPLPWLVVLGAIVGAVWQGAADVVYMCAVYASAPSLLSLPAVLSIPGRCRVDVVPAVLFAYGLAAADRLAPRRSRPVRWALAGGAAGLVTYAVPYLLRGWRLVPSVFVPPLLQALLVTAASGLIYAVFAAWRRPAPFAFGLAGAAAGVASWLGRPLGYLFQQWLFVRQPANISLSMLLGMSSGPWIASAILRVTGGALFGACFGLAIMASEAWARRQEGR